MGFSALEIHCHIIYIAKTEQFIYLVKGTRVTRVKQQICFLILENTHKMESKRRPCKAIFLICLNLSLLKLKLHTFNLRAIVGST